MDRQAKIAAMQRIGVMGPGIEFIDDDEQKSLRHVRTPAGERTYHEPIGAAIMDGPFAEDVHIPRGPRPRERNWPMLRGKVSKLSVHYPEKGAEPVHRVIQKGPSGTLYTEHRTFEAADDHVDQVLAANPHLGSVTHRMKGTDFTVHHSEPLFGQVDIGTDTGKVQSVQIDTDKPLVEQLSRLASGKEPGGKAKTNVGKPGNYKPSIDELTRVIGHTVRKDEVERLGHRFGADVSPGDTVYGFHEGGYRRGVATHVSPSKVTMRYVNEGDLDQAKHLWNFYNGETKPDALNLAHEHIDARERQGDKFYEDMLAHHELDNPAAHQHMHDRLGISIEQRIKQKQAEHDAWIKAEAKKPVNERVHVTTATLPREQVAPLVDGGFHADAGTLLNPPAKSYPEISLDDLSTEDGRRSRPVSAEEFQKIAAEGERKYKSLMNDNVSPPDGLDRNWHEIVERAYAEVKKPWGGATIDAHTGNFIGADSADSYSVFHEDNPSAVNQMSQYALTMRPPGMPTLAIPPNVSRKGFEDAMEEARRRYASILIRPGAALGVFHDADLNRIDIDPVMVANSLHDVETLGSYTRATGGAYNFADGLGYWPPHISEGAQ